MPRRREVPKRKIIPDPKFKDKLITKFNNSLMLSGKKSSIQSCCRELFLNKNNFLDKHDIERYSLCRSPAYCVSAIHSYPIAAPKDFR